jgi:hypothetical protein
VLRRSLILAMAVVALVACRARPTGPAPTPDQVRAYIVQSFEAPPPGARPSTVWRSVEIEPGRAASAREMISANIPERAIVYPVRAEFTRTVGDEATLRIVYLVFWRDAEGRLEGSSIPHEGERTETHPAEPAER